MKKITLAMVVVATSILANAAEWTWGLASGALFDGTGTATKMNEGTSVYLMLASSYLLSDIVSDFAKGSISTSKAIATTTVQAGGKLSEGIKASADVSGSQSAYLAIVYGDRLFLSSAKDTTALDVGTGSIAIDSPSYLSRYNNTTASLLPDNQASAGYSGAGWYAVPEPTSGLLLLLGVAGLALKRKVA